MPSLNLVITGDPKGAEIITKALTLVKRKAFETELALDRIGKTKVTPTGVSKLEVELRRVKGGVKELDQAMKTAALSTDKLEKEVIQLKTQLKGLTGATTKQTAAARGQIATNSALRDSTRGVAGALGGLWFAYGQLLPLMAAFATAASLRKGIQEGGEFAQQMQFVKGVTGAAADEIDRASVAVLSMGESNLRGPIELAKGMRVLTKAGLDLNSALVALEPVMQLSVVGELDIAKATKIATAAMNTFGKTAKDLPEVVNIIGKASIISATEVGDLGNALSFMTGSVGILQSSLPEMSAQLAIAAQRGVTGSKAGTALNRAWLNLAAQSPKTKRALRELGVEVFDTTGKFRGMPTVLSELSNSLNEFTPESQSNLIKAIFGVRSIKAIVPVLAEANNRLPEFRDKIDEASEGLGTMARITADLENNFKGALAKAASSLSATLISSFRAAEPAFTGLAEAFDRLFRTKEFRSFTTSIMKGLANVAKFVVEHRALILGLGKAYLMFKIGGIVTAPLMRGFTAIAAAGGGVTGAFTAMKVGAAAMIGPAGWAALAAAGIIALVWQLNKLKEMKRSNFDLFSESIGDKFTSTIDRMKNKVQGLREELERLREPDISAREGFSLKSSLDQLIVEKDIIESKLRAAKLGGEVTAPGSDVALKGFARARAIRSLISDVQIAREKVSGLSVEYNKFLDLQQQEKRIKGVIAFTTAGQVAPGEGPAAAGALSAEGTKTQATFSLSDLQSQYRDELGALNSKLQTEKRLLDASRSARVVSEKEFVERRRTLAESSARDRLIVMETFLAVANKAQADGFADGNNIQNFASKISVEQEKTRNKEILDARLALISELGKANAEFERIEKGAEAGILKFKRSIAKSEATGIFGQVSPRELMENKIALLKEENDRKFDLVNSHSLALEATEEERKAFNEQQTLARLRLHQEFEIGKTAITKEAEIARRKATIDGLKSLHTSTSSMLGSIADLIGANTEKSFKRAQRFRVAQALMDTAAGAAGAFADTGGHIVIRIAAAAAAVLAGMVRVRQIKSQSFSGQAHDGLPEVPSTGTFLLEKGERVVKKEDNKKLQKFLDEEQSGAGSQPIIVQFNVSAIDGRSVGQFFAANESHIVGLVQKAYDQRLATGGPIK